jgi:hypothetical protein
MNCLLWQPELMHARHLLFVAGDSRGLIHLTLSGLDVQAPRHTLRTSRVPHSTLVTVLVPAGICRTATPQACSRASGRT